VGSTAGGKCHSGFDASILDVRINDDDNKKPAAMDKKTYSIY
jgi:hypothetical protein